MIDGLGRVVHVKEDEFGNHGVGLEFLNLSGDSEEVIEKIKIPLVYGGGCGKIDHVLDLIKKFPHLSGVSISSAFHYNYYKGIFDRKF